MHIINSMSDKKHSRRSEPQLSGHWEVCKNYLALDRQLGTEKDLNPFRVSIINNKKLSEILVPKILDLISTLCNTGVSYEEISQSLDSALIILEYLIKVSKIKFTKTQMSTFFTDLLSLTSLHSQSKQGKINTLALFTDNLLVIITNNKDFKESSKEIFENFFEFLLKFRDTNLKDLLEGSISMRESLSFDGTNFENSHFLEYVLLVILSLCKFHDFSTDHEISFKIFDIVLSMIDKPEGEPSKSGFIVNNLVLALNILYYLGKGLNEKNGILLKESERLKHLIVNGMQSLVCGVHNDAEVSFVSMHKSPYIASKLLSIIFMISDCNLDICVEVNKALVEIFVQVLKVFNEFVMKISEKGSFKLVLFNVLEFVYLRFLKENRMKSCFGAEKVVIQPIWWAVKDKDKKIGKYWERNVEKIFERADRVKIKEAVLDVIKENFESFEFLQEFNCWVSEMEASDESKLKILVCTGMAKEILYILYENDCETKDILFQIVNSLLKLAYLPDQNEMLNIILLKILIHKPTLSEYCEVWLSKLITFHQDKTLIDFISYTCQITNSQIHETILNSILKAQSNKLTNFSLNKTLITKDFLSILSEILIRNSKTSQSRTVNLWKKTFDVFEEILKKEELVFQNTGIKFEEINSVFLHEFSPETKTNLISSTFKQLKHIVISKDYSSFRTPSGIPLLLTYFSQENLKKVEKTRMKFEQMLKISSNFNHSIKHGLVSFLISCIHSNTALILWTNAYKTLSKSISIHFSTSNLRIILNLLKTSKETQTKLALLECLHDALALTPERSSNFSFNSNSQLKVFFDSDFFTLQNEFSIVVWFLPDCKSKSIILTLNCSQDNIFVKTMKEKIVVCVNDNSFEAGNWICNTWNLLCINFKYVKVARMVKNKKLTVSLNGAVKSFKEQAKLNFAQKNLMKCLTLAGSNQKYSNFVGKISGVYVYDFRLKQQHVDFLLNLEPYECPHFLSSSLKYVANKQCQDLKSHLKYYCTKDSVFHYPNTQSTVLCDTFSWSSIPQVILAYTPTRFLVELISSCHYESETLTKSFEIVLRLTLSKSMEVSSEFIKILAHLINACELNDRIYEIFVMIFTNIPDSHSKDLFEGLYQSISEYPSKSRHLSSICRRFKELYPFTRENLYKFCQLIKNTDRSFIKKSLEDYMGPSIESHLSDTISFVMVSLLFNDQVDIIEGFLSIISRIDINFMNSTKIATVFIHVLEKVNVDQVRILVIQCLLRGLQEEDDDLIKTALYLIDEVLPDSINFNLAKFLIEGSFMIKENFMIVRVAFFEMIGNRLKFCNDLKVFKYLAKILNEHTEDIMKIIYNSEIFPRIFFESHENEEIVNVVDEVLETVFDEAVRNGEFDKICFYLRENPRLSIYCRLLFKSDLKDTDTLFNFLNLLKEYLKYHPVLEIDTFLSILKYLTTPNLREFYAETMTLKEVLCTSVKTPKKKSESSKIKFKCLLIEIIQIFILSLSSSHDHSKEILKVFNDFLDSSTFKWFNRNRCSSNQDRIISENLFAVFIFIEILHIFEESHKRVSHFLLKFMKNTQIFSKLIFFFDKRDNKEILEIYDKVPSNYAILSHQSMNDNEGNVESFSSAAGLNVIEGSKYEDYKNFLDNLRIEFISSETKSFDFISNQFWQEIYETLQTIIKNFKKSVSIFFRTSIEGENTINPSTFHQYSKVFMELHENPWIFALNQSSERVLAVNKRKFEKFSMNLEKMIYFIEKPELSNKVRQVYDKFYRWPLVKYRFDKEKKVNIDGGFVKTSNSNRSSYLSLSTSVYTKTSEKMLYRFDVEVIKVQGNYSGCFEINDTYIEVKFNWFVKEGQNENCFSLPVKSIPKFGFLYWQPEDIIEIFFHRVVHKHSALEFILKSGKSYLIDFNTEINRNEVVSKLKTWPNAYFIKSEKPFLDSLSASWKSCKTSTFEYLMTLNKLSGRSSHDLSQYPVFPWLLQDYSIFSLVTTSLFRNFHYPVGAQTEEMQKEAKRRYIISDPDYKPYHYGSHYSSPAVVSYYLLRLEPFMSQAKEIQGGCFDRADRLFHDFVLSWKSCLSFTGDVKELIPELFYQPFALANPVYTTFGKTQTNKIVENVELPTWALGPEDFIKKHRLALESNYVSAEISNWIDLVFGFKQYGKNAVDSFNVFTCTTCEESFKYLCEKSPKLAQSYFQQAYHFGMHPSCLFKTAKHVKRDEVKRNYFLQNCLKSEFKLKKVENKNESFGKVHAAFVKGRKIYLVKSQDEEFCVFRQKMIDDDLENRFEASEFLMEYYYRANEDLQFFGANAFCLFKGKFLVSGFSSTKSLMVHTTKGKILFSCSLHTDLVTVTCASKSQIFSGSLDSTVIGWNVNESSVNPACFYYGHTSSIIQLCTIDSYCLLLSLSVSGLLLLHDTRSSFPIRSLNTLSTLISISELGLISLCDASKISFYSINFTKLSETAIKSQVKNLKFSESGDTCIELYQDSLILRDPTDPSILKSIALQNTQDFVFDEAEEFLFVARNKIKDLNQRETCGLYVIQQIRKC